MHHPCRTCCQYWLSWKWKTGHSGRKNPDKIQMRMLLMLRRRRGGTSWVHASFHSMNHVVLSLMKGTSNLKEGGIARSIEGQRSVEHAGRFEATQSS